MAKVQSLINKITKALKAKGWMPLIKQEQFYGDGGQSITKYVVHYGTPIGKRNDVIATVYSKVDLLKVLIEILKVGDSNG